jgi:DNA-directed RNA polymerase specialized sigma24 family protein
MITPSVPLPLPSCNLSLDEITRLHRYIHFLVSKHGLHDYCDMDDICQEVKLAFCLAINRRAGGSIEYRTAFLRKIAFRYIMKIWKYKEQQQEIIRNLVGNQYGDGWQNSNPLDQIHQSDLIRDARKQLTAQENELIELRIMKGMAWANICRYYRDRGETWPPDTLRQRYCRIKNKLKTFLLEQGIDTSDI